MSATSRSSGSENSARERRARSSTHRREADEDPAPRKGSRRRTKRAARKGEARSGGAAAPKRDAPTEGSPDREARTKARPRPATARRKGRDKAQADPARLLLQRLIAVTPDGVVTLKASGGLGQWSVAASRITGRRRRDVQRSGVVSLFRDAEEYERLIVDLEARGRVSDRELVLLKPGGEEVPVRVNGTRLKHGPSSGPRAHGRRHKRARKRDRGAAADFDRYLLVLHDMTEVQHIRHRLIETEKLSAMAKIAGSVAHEFRNPLNSLFLSTDLLEDELEGREEIREAIEPTLLAIREEIERLNQIITHYLSLSKIASSTPETLELGAVVDDFVSEWQDRAEEQGFMLQARADDGPHSIRADPNQVRRIMVNLVENAFDALEAREEVEGARLRPGRVSLILRRMRRSVKLTVKDNGPGIPGENRERVFEPFFTSKTGGSGLGLYLVREIVLAAGGSMSLSSGDGRGTSVSVRWPLVEAGKERGVA